MPVSESFSRDKLLLDGLLESPFEVGCFGGGPDDSENMQEWLQRHAAEHQGPVGVHLHFAEVYYLRDHRTATKTPAVYAVDVITIATNKWCMVWRACQCQEENAWEPPGPYIAANKSKNRTQKHNDDRKWSMLPCVEEFLTRKGVVLVGMGIKGMMTRLKRTFFSSKDRGFKPETFEVGRAGGKGRSPSLRAAVLSRFGREMLGKDDPRVMGVLARGS